MGAWLALISAVFFGLNNATVRRGVLKSTVLHGLAITVPLGVPFFLVFALLFGGFGRLQVWELSAWVWMMLAGVVHFVIGRYGNYRATQALGGTLSAPIQQVSILIALILAFIFLDETINAVKLVGILLVIVGPLAVVRQRKKMAGAKVSNDFTPNFGAGIGWGIIGSVGYGTSPILIALGLGAAPQLADGVAGVLVSYVAASVVVAVLVMMAGGRKYMASMDRGSSGWFVISSIFVAISQLFRYLALTIAPVSVVVPIQRLSVIFRIFFNAAINREHEVFDGWVIFSIILSIVGALALTIDSAMLLRALALSEGQIQVLTGPIF